MTSGVEDYRVELLVHLAAVARAPVEDHHVLQVVGLVVVAAVVVAVVVGRNAHFHKFWTLETNNKKA